MEQQTPDSPEFHSSSSTDQTDSTRKRIVFLTGTRADFGKLKTLIRVTDNAPQFDVHIFATGMHMLAKYGMTVREVEKSRFSSIFRFINQRSGDSMDVILAKTIAGLSDYVKEIRPDMLVIHGDRVEAMAGAIVGSLNNIYVTHIEGGEVSGTIDELIRHSVSKLSHLHLVSNEQARTRLLQLGEQADSVKIIGSPDLDLMASEQLPGIQETKDRYGIPFDDFAILMYHPVTTEQDQLQHHIRQTITAVRASGLNYVVIYPNNDEGSDTILSELATLSDHSHFRIFPSIRFECFLTLLKNARFIIGNSSAGVREAPFYGLPSINIGSRQNNRASAPDIIHVTEDARDILAAISQVCQSHARGSQQASGSREFGHGNSHTLFYRIMTDPATWQRPKQKYFVDMPAADSPALAVKQENTISTVISQ